MDESIFISLVDQSRFIDNKDQMARAVYNERNEFCSIATNYWRKMANNIEDGIYHLALIGIGINMRSYG